MLGDLKGMEATKIKIKNNFEICLKFRCDELPANFGVGTFKISYWS